MNPSVLTLHELNFMRVHIDIDFEVKKNAKDFDFDGALLGWNISHGRSEIKGDNWWVVVGFANSNEKAENKCPYLLDIQAMGFFDIRDGIPDEKRESIIYENGAALVYGAIREMVLTVTGRFLPGPLMLPTPTFMGEFSKQKEKKKEKRNI